MFARLGTKLAVFLLKNGRLTNEQRQILTICLFDQLGALPLRARITEDISSTIFIDGKALKVDVAKRLRESSRLMLSNFARTFVREQVVWMAVQKGVHENISPEQGLFAKAALWFFQEENELYKKLAQFEVGEDDQ